MDSPEGREAIPSGDAFGIRRYAPQNDNDVAVFVQNDIPQASYISIQFRTMPDDCERTSLHEYLRRPAVHAPESPPESTIETLSRSSLGLYGFLINPVG